MEAVTESRGVMGVGYEGKAADTFIRELVASGTQLLVDVRLNPVSRKRGFSKRALTAALADAGISYCHAPQLGNPVWNRPGFAGTPQEVRAARERFGGMLANEEAGAALRQIDAPMFVKASFGFGFSVVGPGNLLECWVRTRQG